MKRMHSDDDSISSVCVKRHIKVTKMTKIESPVDFLEQVVGCERYKKDVSSCSMVVNEFSVSEKRLSNYNMKTIQAIREKDINALSQLLKEGQNFDACNRNGESLLHLACRRGNKEVVEFLVDKAEVDVTCVDSLGRTVVHDLCWRATPDTDMMKVLLRRIPSRLLLQEDVRGHTPFDFARKEHWGVWTEFLRENQEDIVPLSSMMFL